MKGDRLFAAVSLSSRNQQITTIPIDQLEIRSAEIEDLIQDLQQQQQQQTQKQSVGAVASRSSSSAKILQLQKELEDERQKNAALSFRLEQKDAELKQKDEEIEALKKEVASNKS